MNRVLSRALLLVLPGLLAASCGTKPLTSPAGESRTVQRPPPPVAQPTKSNSDYVAAVGAFDLFEIRSAEIAMRRTRSLRVREFAAAILKDHKGTSAQLSLAGRRLNLLPSATLTPAYQEMIGTLEQRAMIDGLFKQQQLRTINAALKLDRAYVQCGSSPTLKAVARARVPILERHLRLLAYL